MGTGPRERAQQTAHSELEASTNARFPLAAETRTLGGGGGDEEKSAPLSKGYTAKPQNSQSGVQLTHRGRLWTVGQGLNLTPCSSTVTY